MSQREDIDLPGSCSLQDPRTFIHGRSCGVDVIHEENRLLVHALRGEDMKHALDLFFPLCPAQGHLRKGVPLLLKNARVKWNSRVPIQLFHQKEGLIESSLPQTPDMERDRDQKVERRGRPVAAESCGEPFPEESRERNPSLIFPTMDGLLERSLIMAQSPRRGEISFSDETGSTRMGLACPRKKGGSADGTEGRLNPTNLCQAIRTDSGCPFRQELATTGTGVREKKLKESF